MGKGHRVSRRIRYSKRINDIRVLHRKSEEPVPKQPEFRSEINIVDLRFEIASETDSLPLTGGAKERPSSP